ncbi:MAG: glycosyltransferase [Campylobacterota bacterium]|nr:glycosyltransferase [Campylobacterota bacterium]
MFVHDEIFLTKNGNVYSNNLPFPILKRYLDQFSQVTVLARSLEVEEIGDRSLASGDGIDFIFLESISTLRSYFGLRQKHHKVIESIVGSHDAVIVRLPSELGAMTAKIAEQRHVKYLVEVVGCAWSVMWYYGGYRSKIYAPFFYLKIKNRVKKSNYTSYVTEQFLQNRYPSADGAKVISLSDVMLPDIDEDIVSQRLSKIEKKREKILFGTIGSLNVKYKGVDSTIEVLSKISQRYEDFEYHILGEGDPAEYQMIAERVGIGDKIFFDGTLPRGEAVYRWLDRMDIYLQPSLTEGLPRSVLEAMSRGCPVVASSVGGMPELLDEDLIFDHKNQQRFFDLIWKMMNDKELMREYAMQNFSRSKEYQEKILNKKRNKFWLYFKEDINL